VTIATAEALLMTPVALLLAVVALGCGQSFGSGFNQDTRSGAGFGIQIWIEDVKN
jgi:hypothetical protein